MGITESGLEFNFSEPPHQCKKLDEQRVYRNVSGSRNATHDSEFWRNAGKLLVKSKKQIIIILWIELNKPENKLKAQLQAYNNDLKRKLKWLTPRIFVTSKKTFKNEIHDLVVIIR